MSCDAVLTGQRFVAQALAHIDCQAQGIGAYGYGALADPGSTVSLALTALFTVFVALFGLRLIAGEAVQGRDLASAVLRIGIVLTLATSWPAWRTLGYDVVMKGPGELATAIDAAADLPGQSQDLVARMQAADDGIVLLTTYGTGRSTGGTSRSDTIGDSFRGIALADQQGFANGRIAFLAGVLGPIALVRLGAGLLLALAPALAGLLLFAGTRDLFFGWLRALAMLGLGALALSVIYGVELAVLEPWLKDALALRDGQVLTPSAPTELVVITLAFAIAAFGMLLLIGRIAFFGGFALPRWFGHIQPGSPGQPGEVLTVRSRHMGEPPTRAFAVADAVAQTMRREERGSERSRVVAAATLARGGTRDQGSAKVVIQEPLGASFRASEGRHYRRNSASGEKRDTKA